MERVDDLDVLFGDNYDPAMTIHLPDEMKGRVPGLPLIQTHWSKKRVYWTKMKGGSGSIEGKVFCNPIPKNVVIRGIPSKDLLRNVLIIIPGYRGDFVSQEKRYAGMIGEMNVIVLRHNGLRVIGEDVRNYIHCPARVELAKKAEQYQYLGDQDFSFLEASLELLTVLEALNLENVENIHILGHSWGARIALLSLDQLIENERQRGISAANRSILQKIRNVILLGPWLEARREKILAPEIESIVVEDAQAGYFRNMRVDQFITDMIDTATCLKDAKLNGFPAPVHIICADQDEHIPDITGEIWLVFEKWQIPQKSLHILGNLKPQMSKTIGGRPIEVHDYAAPVVYNMIQEILSSAD